MKKIKNLLTLSDVIGYFKFLFSFYFLLCFLLLLSSCQPSANKEKEAIKQVMMQQQQAWNKGDIEGFMQGYWNNDSLLFIGSKGLTYGWQTTLENYRASYGTKEKMGTLKFTIKKIQMITPFEALMVGKWELKRKNDKPKGYFTLLWKKFDDQWRVVIDHTS